LTQPKEALAVRGKKTNKGELQNRGEEAGGGDGRYREGKKTEMGQGVKSDAASDQDAESQKKIERANTNRVRTLRGRDTEKDNTIGRWLNGQKKESFCRTQTPSEGTQGRGGETHRNGMGKILGVIRGPQEGDSSELPERTTSFLQKTTALEENTARKKKKKLDEIKTPSRGEKRDFCLQVLSHKIMDN